MLVNAGFPPASRPLPNPLSSSPFTILPKTAPEGTTINSAELWDAVLTGKYTAFKNDIREVNIQLIYHGGVLGAQPKSRADERDTSAPQGRIRGRATLCPEFFRAVRGRGAADHHPVGALWLDFRRDGQPRDHYLGEPGDSSAVRGQGRYVGGRRDRQAPWDWMPGASIRFRSSSKFSTRSAARR